jgi:DNA end-binding protein Ku
MKETRYDALAKVTMHSREHIVILRPSEHGIVLHTMYFMEELHQANELSISEPAKFDKKEIDLAKRLIETLAAPFQPDRFHDEYKQNVEKLIEKKRTGQKITPIKQPKQPKVIDLMQALQESLAHSSRSAKSSAPRGSKSASRTRTARKTHRGGAAA